MTNSNASQQVEVFEDVLSLLEYLKKDHNPEIHLYRGQMNRFTHQWEDEKGPITLESIYPSDYRFITNYNSPRNIPPSDVSSARSYGRNVRDLFFSTMTLKAATDAEDWKWLREELGDFLSQISALREKQNNGHYLEKIANGSEEDVSMLSTPLIKVFWSLAQHYLIATALTDVSFSPRVAAWFATQPWDASKEAPTEGKGVIYRFNRELLEEVLQQQSKKMSEYSKNQGYARPPELFFVDIRNIPREFAGRPYGQQGGSVYGFDQPEVIRKIMQRGGLEVFEFSHSLKAAEVKDMREDIVPEKDPFAEFAEKLNNGIRQATKVDVSVVSEDGILLDVLGTNVFSRLKLDARLAIKKARLIGKIPIADEYMGYHFKDIESTGHHGYTSLLAVVNEKTDGIRGYVSLEPVAPISEDFPASIHIIASWFNNRRVVMEMGLNETAQADFVNRAVSIAQEALGKGAVDQTIAGLQQISQHFGGTIPAIESLAESFEKGNLDAGVDLGMLLIGKNKADLGEEILKTAYSLGSVNAAFNLGAIRMQTKNYQEAETWFLEALKLGDKEAHYNLGRVHESMRNWDRAEHYYRLAHEIDSDHRAPNNLGMALYHLGRKEEARKYFEMAVKAGDNVAAYNLGSLEW